jgi:acyl-CoA hydrolase
MGHHNPVGEKEFHTEQSVLMTELVLPSHSNVLGTIFGGVVMSWIDIACAIAAGRYARSPVVTVSIDYLHFIVPIKIWYTVQIHARITYAGKTSMEAEAIVEAENPLTGKIDRATHAYLTFVSLDAQGCPKAVPQFKPNTPHEKKIYEEALVRRKRRLEWIQK